MSDPNRPYTQRDIDAQAKRTRILDDIRAMTRDREARTNRSAFSPEPGLTTDAMLELFEPDLLRQEREDKRRNDEIEDAIAEPRDPDLDKLMGIED